ncbi:hypothetical protein LGT39_12450 [Demequina sp. TTPB684]|uniref:hypothetical protein n=1 Tax=unclassified Demequina TaxID=2620311 RepID=UPI001CF396BB|nr:MULTISPECIES: hypothetical protein [unclassified Demequina]MCB2413655.1 hypothetical protein [Demequina sp. TTPB684]UPU87718.1 hypothetical protein LGT36_010705 [Demequina sp. TMPB413]
MDPKKLHAELLRSISEKYKERATVVAELTELRGQDTPDDDKVAEALNRRKAIDAELGNMEGRAADLSAEIAEDELAATRAAEVHKGAELPEERETSTRVITEESPYRADRDPKGKAFMQDVARSFLGDTEARSRLEKSTRQVLDARKDAGTPVAERIASTANVSGFAIPEYLTDLFAPEAKEGAQLANSDNMTVHELPATGMVAYLPKVATGTSVDEQSAEGADVDETDFDDELITVPIYTVAGSQSVPRQVLDRAPDASDAMLEDLVREYYTDKDRKAILRASTGLLAAGTAVTYTDASPTAIELYAKILQAISGVEEALKDQTVDGDIRVLMRRNRWRWLMNQFIDTHPFISGRNVGAQGQGVITGALKGVRGYLPSDDPVVTDGNLPSNLGAGTNEDRVAVYAKKEAHLWEDPSAPLMIRAEQTQSKKLKVDFVVYGYQATCFERYDGAVQVIGGTGLVPPTF